MDNKAKVYKVMSNGLKDVIKWSTFNRQELINENCDLDSVIADLKNNYNISLNYGILNHIYSLADSFCDAKRHGFEYLVEGYTVEEATKDILYIIHMIDNEEIQDLENNTKLLERIDSIFE